MKSFKHLDNVYEIIDLNFDDCCFANLKDYLNGFQLHQQIKSIESTIKILFVTCYKKLLVLSVHW